MDSRAIDQGCRCRGRIKLVFQGVAYGLQISNGLQCAGSLTVDRDFNVFIQIEKFVGEKELHSLRDIAGDADFLTIDFRNDFLFFGGSAFRQLKPIEPLMGHIVLIPDDFFGQGLRVNFAIHGRASASLRFIQCGRPG